MLFDAIDLARSGGVPAGAIAKAHFAPLETSERVVVHPANAATLSRMGMAELPRADSGTAVTSTIEEGPFPLVRTKSWRAWKARSVAR